MAELSGAQPDPGGNWTERLRTGGALAAAMDGDLIAIKDGVTYIAIIPFTDGTPQRDVEVAVSHEFPLLLVHVFAQHGEAIPGGGSALAGFVLKMGDEKQYGSFDNFRRQAATPVEIKRNADEQFVDLRTDAGDDSLYMRYSLVLRPEWEGQPPQVIRVLSRTINGEPAYLPEGIHRQSPWSIQSVLPLTRFNGAELYMEPERRGYIQADGKSGVYRAYNLLPDPTLWSFRLDDGVQVTADGRVGLLRVQIEPAKNLVQIDHQVKSEHAGRPDMARNMLLGGMDERPDVILNGRNVDRLRRETFYGERFWMLPLNEEAAEDTAEAIVERMERVEDLWQILKTAEVTEAYMQDWHVIGPFPSDKLAAGMKEVYPPEQEIDLDATYEGVDGAAVRWQPLLKEGEPKLAAAPVNLHQPFKERQGYVAYAATLIRSDRERDAALYVGLHHFSRIYLRWVQEDAAMWFNGEKVLEFNAHEQPGRDGISVPVHLKAGDNTILFKFSRATEPSGWHLFVRLGDEYGFPITDGIEYGRLQGRRN